MVKKRAYRSLAELEHDFKLAIIDVIQNEVFEVIKNELVEEMQRRVYDVYEPKNYKRRHANGGLLDGIEISKPIVSDKFVSFVVENLAKGNDIGDFSGKLINEMIESEDGFAGNPSQNMPARPYTEYAYTNLISSASRNDLKQAFYTGLRARGFNITIK